ncbi:MAG: hypothetical protein WCO35_01535 [Candidatus Nomurabacteria bacterium]
MNLELSFLNFIQGTIGRPNDYGFHVWNSLIKGNLRNYSITTCLLSEENIEKILLHDYTKEPLCIIKAKSYFVDTRSIDYKLVENYEIIRDIDGKMTEDKTSIFFPYPFNFFDRKNIEIYYLKNRKEIYYNFLLNEFVTNSSYSCGILTMNAPSPDKKIELNNGFLGEWWTVNTIGLIIFLEEKLKGFSYYLNTYKVYEREFRFMKENLYL